VGDQREVNDEQRKVNDEQREVADEQREGSGNEQREGSGDEQREGSGDEQREGSGDEQGEGAGQPEGVAAIEAEEEAATDRRRAARQLLLPPLYVEFKCNRVQTILYSTSKILSLRLFFYLSKYQDGSGGGSKRLERPLNALAATSGADDHSGILPGGGSTALGSGGTDDNGRTCLSFGLWMIVMSVANDNLKQSSKALGRQCTVFPYLRPGRRRSRNGNQVGVALEESGLGLLG